MPRPRLKIDLLPMTPENKQRLMAWIPPLKGDYRVYIEPARGTRSQRANRYYFSCVVTPFARYLSDEEVQIVSVDAAHEILKREILGPVIVRDPRTRQVLSELTPSTHDMDPEQFMDFVERAREWLVMFHELRTPDPDPEYAAKREAVAR